MSDPVVRLQQITNQQDSSLVRARVISISESGAAVAELNGRKLDIAESLVQWPTLAAARKALIDKHVLLCLLADGQAILIGMLQATVVGEVDTATADKTVTLDANAVLLTADKEIRLDCGQSSLVLRRDGSVVIRGVKVTSRASQSNKIRGASVNIN
ncbi:MAG: hypothetical protein HKN49_12580 [Gammaproteobacteria bacterium]|nr:hypothetical protein [Gammaproteobacteria bacterium]